MGFLTLLNAKTLFSVNKYSPLQEIVRHSSVVKKQKRPKGTTRYRNIIASSCESLAARGFLRSYKPYTPVPNVTSKVVEICKTVLGTNYDANSPLSIENKYNLLNACFEELNHSVPNSLLHKIENVNNIIEFYNTPVSTTVPYDELLKKDLPPNLHLQADYIRFNPDTDTKFKGISAFPRSSTIVTGLKSKEKYSGYRTKSAYPETEAILDEIKN